MSDFDSVAEAGQMLNITRYHKVIADAADLSSQNYIAIKSVIGRSGPALSSNLRPKRGGFSHYLRFKGIVKACLDERFQVLQLPCCSSTK